MSITEEQSAFYGELYRRHGDDPRTLSHRDLASQRERFHRIALVFRGEDGPFSVHEVGCGLGHLGDYLAEYFPRAVYSGSEVNPDFVAACRERFPQNNFFLRDVSRELPSDRHDFVTLSGTFNIPLKTPRDVWRRFIFEMLEAMYGMSLKGIAVNFLSTYCDADRMRAELHYQPEKEILDFATSRLSRHYELDNGGPLYEYTLRVYRPEHVRALYEAPEFDRYF